MTGFQGFENERFRQECLKGIFREKLVTTTKRQALLQKSYKSSISFEDFFSDIPASLKPQYPKHELESRYYEDNSSCGRDSIRSRFGMSTGYGLTEGQHYDRITAQSTPYRPYVIPPLRAHGKKVPINILPEDEIYQIDEEVQEDEDNVEDYENQLPTATQIGVKAPPGACVSEFQNSDFAFNTYNKHYKPELQRTNLCSSHYLLQRDRLRHTGLEYASRGSLAGTPLTTSSDIGGQVQGVQNLYRRPQYGLRNCKETRFAQTMLVMAKSPFGHHGQSCL